MERQQRYLITQLIQRHIKGINQITSKKLPNTIVLQENYMIDEEESLLIRLWQTLLEQSCEKLNKQSKSISWRTLQITLHKRLQQIELRIQSYTSSVIFHPEEIIHEFLNDMTINPLQFLTASPVDRALTQDWLCQQLNTTTNMRFFPLSDFNVKNNNLTFRNIIFEEANKIEKIAFSMAIAMTLKPFHQIIRISNWALLKRKHFEIVQHLALKANCMLWVISEQPNILNLAKATSLGGQQIH